MKVWIAVLVLVGSCQEGFWSGGAGRDGSDSCGLCDLCIADADAAVLFLEPHLCNCPGRSSKPHMVSSCAMMHSLCTFLICMLCAWLSAPTSLVVIVLPGTVGIWHAYLICTFSTQ